MVKTKISITLMVLALVMFAIACSQGAPAPAQAPVASSGKDLPRYSISSIYDDAYASSAQIVRAKMTTKAWLTSIAWGLVILSVGIAFFGSNLLGLGLTALVAVIIFIFSLTNVTRKIPSTIDSVGHNQANIAINEGVSRAQKEQASNFQYIAATFNAFGFEVMICTDPVNYYSDCSNATHYYTNRDVNCHRVCESTDDDGSCTSWGEDCDTQHVSWFPYLVHYWVSPATKAKYIFDGIYDFKCLNPDNNFLDDCHRDDTGTIDDKRQPAIFLNADWRPPKGAEIRDAAKTFFGSYDYNDRIPQLWSDLQKSTGQSTITGYFVGKYFHWGFGANSPQFVVYEGPYRDLKKLVDLPGPNGKWFNYTDGFGKQVSINTLLYSDDEDLATKLNPVFFLGFDSIDPKIASRMNDKAREFQGTYGPGKESINYIVVVNQDAVKQMGGIVNTTTGVMGWLQDETLWGLFRMPKNQTLVVVSASPDLKTFDQLNFETGLPFGNELVKQRIRMSVGETTPFTWESLMGEVTSKYLTKDSGPVNNGQRWVEKLDYSFNDMAHDSGIIGLLYENNLPENTDKFPQPDPNSDECTTAQPNHVGYIRYQMCTQQYLETTIQVNENGRQLIMNQVTTGSNAAINNTGSALFLAAAIILIIAVLLIRAQIST